MALLPSEPKQQKAVGAIAIALVAFYGYWSFYHSGRVEALAVNQEHLEALESRNQGARVQNLRGGVAQMQERALEYERHVRRLEELIPAAEEVAPLINQLTLESRELGVRIMETTPLTDVPGQYYTQHSYSLQVVGDYHDVGRYLTAIASRGRIITPVRVSLEPYDQGQGNVGNFEAPILVTFEIQTFILPDPNSAPPPELGGEAAGDAE